MGSETKFSQASHGGLAIVRSSGICIVFIDYVVTELGGFATARTDKIEPHENVVRLICWKVFLQQFTEHAPGFHFLPVNFDILARAKPQIDHRLKLAAVTRVADRFVIESIDLSQKCVGQRRSPARGLKRLEWRKSLERKRLDLSHRFNFDDLAVADNPSFFDVFVDQALDRKNELVFQ